MNRKAKKEMIDVIDDIMSRMTALCGKDVKSINNILEDVFVISVEIKLVNGDRITWNNMPAYCMEHKKDRFPRMSVVGDELVKIEDKTSDSYIPLDNILYIKEIEGEQPVYDTVNHDIYIQGKEYPLSKFIPDNISEEKGGGNENV